MLEVVLPTTLDADQCVQQKLDLVSKGTICHAAQRNPKPLVVKAVADLYTGSDQMQFSGADWIASTFDCGTGGKFRGGAED